jgi:hypothetical protein
VLGLTGHQRPVLGLTAPTLDLSKNHANHTSVECGGVRVGEVERGAAEWSGVKWCAQRRSGVERSTVRICATAPGRRTGAKNSVLINKHLRSRADFFCIQRRADLIVGAEIFQNYFKLIVFYINIGRAVWHLDVGLIASWGWSRSQGFGCSPIKAVRELGLKRREIVWSLSTVGAGYLRGSAYSTRAPGWTDRWCSGCHACGIAG